MKRGAKIVENVIVLMQMVKYVAVLIHEKRETIWGMTSTLLNNS